MFSKQRLLARAAGEILVFHMQLLQVFSVITILFQKSLFCNVPFKSSYWTSTAFTEGNLGETRLMYRVNSSYKGKLVESWPYLNSSSNILSLAFLACNTINNNRTSHQRITHFRKRSKEMKILKYLLYSKQNHVYASKLTKTCFCQSVQLVMTESITHCTRAPPRKPDQRPFPPKCRTKPDIRATGIPTR